MSMLVTQVERIKSLGNSWLPIFHMTMKTLCLVVSISQFMRSWLTGATVLLSQELVWPQSGWIATSHFVWMFDVINRMRELWTLRNYTRLSYNTEESHWSDFCIGRTTCGFCAPVDPITDTLLFVIAFCSELPLLSLCQVLIYYV